MAAQPWPAVATSPGLHGQIKTSKVLCIGAGGIGCEVLKTLVMTGFEDIELIDMDTIETSNLNRQFLFRKRHVGQSKAKVAAEAVRRFRPNSKIVFHQGNVKEPQFDKGYFKRFSLVLSGLDNVEARRHVNRLCLSAGVPLIESGTEGYLGQVTPHFRLRNAAGETTRATECFECAPKPSRNKTYPVCTIRNTPDKPIHCIVWAKELLFARLFGRFDQVTDLDEGGPQRVDHRAGENQQQPNGGGSSGGGGAEQQDSASSFVRREGEGAEGYARRIFQRVFCEDVRSVLQMEELWTTREKPVAVDLDAVLADEKGAAEANGVASARSNGAAGELGVSACKALGLTDQHRVWSVRESAQEDVHRKRPGGGSAQVFLESVRQYLEGRPGEVGAAVFDKEDDLAVEFVTAASNLRAAAYGIPQQTLFATKGMAGNIIHAIATTNAIVGGLIVIEALKLLAGRPEQCKATFILRSASNPKAKRLLNAVAPGDPSPKCAACGTARLELRVDTAATTLAQLLDQVLRKRLSLVQPTVRTDGGFEYEEGEGLDEDEVEANRAKLPVALAQLPGGGLGQGVTAYIEDQVQDFKVQVEILHKDDWDEEQDPEGFTLGGAVPPPTAAAAAAAGPSTSAAGAGDVDEDDDLIIMDEPSVPDNTRLSTSKRAAQDDADAEPGPSKRRKAEPGADNIISLE